MNVKNKVLRGCGSAAVAFGAASAMLPAQAFADEGSGVAAILPQMDEFIPMLVAFIILWIILAKFGWPLFEGMLVKRETTIKDALEQSENARVESERVLAEYKRSWRKPRRSPRRSSPTPRRRARPSRPISPPRPRLRLRYDREGPCCHRG